MFRISPGPSWAIFQVGIEPLRSAGGGGIDKSNAHQQLVLYGQGHGIALPVLETDAVMDQGVINSIYAPSWPPRALTGSTPTR